MEDSTPRNDVEGAAMDERRLAKRQTFAAISMANFGKWLRDMQPGVPPKTPLGRAITYAVNHWASFQVYLTDSCVPIDSNGAAPYAYMRDVLERISRGRPGSRVAELLPEAWAAEKARAAAGPVPGPPNDRPSTD